MRLRRHRPTGPDRGPVKGQLFSCQIPNQNQTLRAPSLILLPQAVRTGDGPDDDKEEQALVQGQRGGCSERWGPAGNLKTEQCPGGAGASGRQPLEAGPDGKAAPTAPEAAPAAPTAPEAAPAAHPAQASRKGPRCPSVPA